MTETDSAAKPADYFDRARREIGPRMPERVTRMLDIGCGAGATTAFVRSLRAVAWAGGVEIEPEEALKANAHLDRLWTIDIAAEPFETAIEDGALDLILCLDVLEHLVDPWAVVRRLTPKLAAGGRLIVSVPNIRNWKFIWRLATRGDFRYRDAGLLDRTHLRFFTRETAAELATAGGLALVSIDGLPELAPPDARWFASRLSLRGLDPLLAKQWLATAVR